MAEDDQTLLRQRRHGDAALPKIGGMGMPRHGENAALPKLWQTYSCFISL